MGVTTHGGVAPGVTESTAGPRAVWELVRRHPRRTGAAAGLLALSGLSEGVGLTALLPLLSVATAGEVTDIPAIGGGLVALLGAIGLPATIEVLLGVIVVAMAGKATLKILARWQVGAAEAAVTAELRRAMIQGFFRARWPYFVRQPAGSLANAVGAETMRAGRIFTAGAEFCAGTILLVIYATLALVMSWQVAIVAAVVGILAARGLRFLVRMSRDAGRDQTQTQNALISRLNDVIYTIKPLKAMGREQTVMPMLDEDITQYQRAQRRTAISGAGVQAAYEPIAAVALAVLMYVLLEIIGVPFEGILFIAVLVLRTVTHVGKVQRNWQEVQNRQYALRVISGTISRLAEEAEPTGGGPAPSLCEALRIESVDFAYEGRPVFESLSLTIPAGEFTAVVGPSGVGKTTLVDLIIGLQQPQGGRVTVDCVALTDMDLGAWRDRIGYVPQETVLFHDTVRANLALGDDRVTETELVSALRAAGALDFVREMPEGLDAVVGEHGLRLSGGQRQRLAIARALVRRPSLLVLDEATTALDPATEEGILSTLEGLRDGLTILAISHQEAVNRHADRIVELAGPGREPTVRITETSSSSEPLSNPS